MKKKRYLFVWLPVGVIVLTCLFPVRASTRQRQPDMRSMGTGGNGATQSTWVNPAVLPLSDRHSFSFQYHNAYGLRELGTLSGGLLYPNAWLPAGIQFASFGYDDYRETLFRLVLGKQLGEQWAVGVSIQYVALQTKLYDEQVARLSTDIGILYMPADRWRIGLTALHTPSVSLGDQISGSRCLTPFSLQAGIGWKLMDGVALFCSAVATDEKTHAETGMEYTLYERLYLRAGVRTHPLLPCFGIGYTLSLFTVDVAATSHPVLGMQTGIGFTFSF